MKGLWARVALHHCLGVVYTSQTQNFSVLQGWIQPIAAVLAPIDSTTSSRTTSSTYARDAASISKQEPSTAKILPRCLCITYARDTTIMGGRGPSTVDTSRNLPPTSHPEIRHLADLGRRRGRPRMCTCPPHPGSRKRFPSTKVPSSRPLRYLQVRLKISGVLPTKEALVRQIPDI